MKTKEKFSCLLSALLLLPAVCFGDTFNQVVWEGGDHRDRQLQASFLQFPLLTPATNGQGELTFQTLDLNSPVNIDGIDFYGFRFKVSGRTASEDFVWAFVQNDFCYWDILPETGKMAGFENYFYEPRTHYQHLDKLLPLKGRDLVTQRFSGDLLEDDKCYLVWFAFKSHKPAQISLEFTFADLQSKKVNRGRILENVLGLHHK